MMNANNLSGVQSHPAGTTIVRTGLTGRQWVLGGFLCIAFLPAGLVYLICAARTSTTTIIPEKTGCLPCSIGDHNGCDNLACVCC